jgi:RecJ-like exonuclease
MFFSFGQREIDKYTIEKTPIFDLGVNIDIDKYSRRLENTRNLSYFSSGMMDFEYFVGNIDVNLKSNEINIEPLTPNMYDDYKNLII